jgi:hypothetical protein
MLLDWDAVVACLADESSKMRRQEKSQLSLYLSPERRPRFISCVRASSRRLFSSPFLAWDGPSNRAEWQGKERVDKARLLGRSLPSLIHAARKWHDKEPQSSGGLPRLQFQLVKTPVEGRSWTEPFGDVRAFCHGHAGHGGWPIP